jgi:hypothetical protein
MIHLSQASLQFTSRRILYKYSHSSPSRQKILSMSPELWRSVMSRTPNEGSHEETRSVGSVRRASHFTGAKG